MGLEVPKKIQVVVTLRDPRTMQCEIDTSATSLGLAIAMLEKALRKCKNEESNQEAVLFGQRMAEEQAQAAVAAAMSNPRKQ